MSAPTTRLISPESLNSVEELRQELHRVNTLVCWLTQDAHTLRHMLHQISGQMGRIVLAHVGGDKDSVQRELTAFVEKHVEITQSPARPGGLR